MLVPAEAAAIGAADPNAGCVDEQEALGLMHAQRQGTEQGGDLAHVPRQCDRIDASERLQRAPCEVVPQFHHHETDHRQRSVSVRSTPALSEQSLLCDSRQAHQHAVAAPCEALEVGLVQS